MYVIADSGLNPKKTNLELILQYELHNKSVSPCDPPLLRLGAATLLHQTLNSVIHLLGRQCWRRYIASIQAVH